MLFVNSSDLLDRVVAAIVSAPSGASPLEAVAGERNRDRGRRWRPPWPPTPVLRCSTAASTGGLAVKMRVLEAAIDGALADLRALV